VQELLDHFQVTAAEVPVVIWRGQVVLRNPTNRQIAECLGFNEAIDQTQIRNLIVRQNPIRLVFSITSSGRPPLVTMMREPSGSEIEC
jgi:hypothetical protein